MLACFHIFYHISQVNLRALTHDYYYYYYREKLTHPIHCYRNADLDVSKYRPCLFFLFFLNQFRNFSFSVNGQGYLFVLTLSIYF